MFRFHDKDFDEDRAAINFNILFLLHLPEHAVFGIFNADEFVIPYNVNHRCRRLDPHERVKYIACGNASSTEHLPQLVVGNRRTHRVSVA